LKELATALNHDANFSTTIRNLIGTKAPLANPTFTGTVSGINKSMVGLGNVDNTTDLNKPISTATQTALDTLTANIDAAYAQGTVANLTANSANSTATATQTALANLTGSTGYTGNVKVSGDIIYNNNNKSLTSQIATLNGYRTSGTIASTTTFQIVYTPSSGTRGFITLTSSSNGMITAFFEYTNNITYPCLVQLAISGNAQQPVLTSSSSTFNGTQTMFIQMLQNGSPPFSIQVKTTTSATVYWNVSLL
jgi:hypothetical protein